MQDYGWVPAAVAARCRATLGLYRGHEWERCAVEIGLRVVQYDLPSWLPAMRIAGALFLSQRLPEAEKAKWAWHEIGHAMMHAGNFQFWDTLPWGHLVLSKQERQAWEFAAAFPIWGEE